MNVGIVPAKAHSSRFPGKNEFVVRGAPLFWHSVQPLLDARRVDRVVVATDSPTIAAFSQQRGVEVIRRARNAAIDDESLFSVLRHAYMQLDEEYDLVVSIMANCPGHVAEDVDAAIALVESRRLREVRSFNRQGEESGLLVLRREVVQGATEISAYMGAVWSDVREIHYREDVDAATG